MSVDMSVNRVIFDTPKAKKSRMWILWKSSLSQRLNQSLVFQRDVHTWGQKIGFIHTWLPLKAEKSRNLFVTTGVRENTRSWLLAGQHMMNLNTLEEVAESLAVSKSTVIRLVRRNQLAVTRIGRAVRISDESLRHFIDSQTSYTRKGQAEE